MQLAAVCCAPLFKSRAADSQCSLSVISHCIAPRNNSIPGGDFRLRRWTQQQKLQLSFARCRFTSGSRYGVCSGDAKKLCQSKAPCIAVLGSSDGSGDRVQEEEKAAWDYAEVAENGTKFWHVIASSIHNVDHGLIMGLTSVRRPDQVKHFEFPLFLNALSANPVQVAIQKGGLPHALEELGNLKHIELEKIYVTSLSSTETGGEFLVFNEMSGDHSKVSSTYPQALALAIRHQQPFFINRDAILSSNRDFVDRMIINPNARQEDGDFEMLSRLSQRMHFITSYKQDLDSALTCAIEKEQYKEALQWRDKVLAYNGKMDVELTEILDHLRKLYLERMNIFFKL